MELAPGQLWSIKSPSPTTIKVIVGEIEPWRDRTAVLVSIIDIPVPEGWPGGTRTTSVGCIPFDESALVASLDQLLATDATPLPSFKLGLQQWSDTDGGVFTVTVSEIIGHMVEKVSQDPNRTPESP